MMRRRHALRLAGAAAAAGLATRPAAATVEEAGALALRLAGGREPRPGRVELELPQIAENGVTVPLTVRVESPMSEADHVRAVHVLAEANPEVAVLTFRFTPLNGRAELSTRIRLAQSQDVWAVAEMSDGSFWLGKAAVKVTIGGCGG
jgi:sulfur-oxidizing protein SoxY